MKRQVPSFPIALNRRYTPQRRFLYILTCAFSALLLGGVAHAVSGKLLHTFQYVPGGTTPLGRMISDAGGNLYGTTHDGGSNNLGVVFELSIDVDGHPKETVLHTFAGPDGANPDAGLVMDSVGNLYGTTANGGSYHCSSNLGCGVVFELIRDQGVWTEKVLHTFTVGNNQDGYDPSGELIFDAKGNLYGMTRTGGTLFGGGTVFELFPANGEWNYQVIHNFDPDGQAASPIGALTIDANGNLYGCTSKHVTDWFENWGTVFELTRTQDSWSETVLNVFDGGDDGGYPNGGLVLDRAGNLYGTTQIGGRNNYGLVFKLVRTGNNWTEHVIHSFHGTDGQQPFSGLTADSTGNLYGTTYSGGNLCDPGGYGGGTVFKMSWFSGRWEGTIVHKFRCGDDGKNPIAPLTVGADGNLYGTTGGGGQFGFSTAFRLRPTGNGVTESVIYKFVSTDGELPTGTMSFDGLGNLFGTTLSGGNRRGGTLFEMTSSPMGAWTGKIIYNFAGNLSNNNPAAGAEPYGKVVIDAHGNIFGTTLAGGNVSFGQSCGTAFQLTPAPNGWTESTIYEFRCAPDASAPNGLVLDSDGNLYGTSGGGAFGFGTVFELSPSPTGWIETVLCSFKGDTDGTLPEAGVVMDADGNLYGVTTAGGTGDCLGAGGCGTIFELVKAQGWSKTVLHDFQNDGKDGQMPYASLVFDSAGNLFGTTGGGGTNNRGTVFELIPNNGRWSEKVLYSFFGADGNRPLAEVTLNPGGDLYGTTYYGGTGTCNDGYAQGCGVIFKLSPTQDGWKETTVYSFTGDRDGRGPYGGVVFGNSGNLYGSTEMGGVGVGVVFEYAP